MSEIGKTKTEGSFLRNPDRISGLVLVLVACIALFAARDLPYGTFRAPDAGFFPRSLSVLLLIFGLGIFGRSLVREPDVLDIDARSWRVVIAAISLCAYALTLRYVGFVLDTIVIMILMMRGFGNMSWKLACLIAVPSVVISYFAFVQLGVPLPAGILPF